MRNFNSPQELQAYINETKKTCLIYEKDVLDVTNFLSDHPGGSGVVEEHNGDDITFIFHDDAIHEHSESALKMLAKYKIGSISYTTTQKKGASAGSENKKEPEHLRMWREKYENAKFPRVEGSKVIYEKFTLDLAKGAAYQLQRLDIPDYLNVIHNPIHVNDLRLYDSSFFEFFSHNKWWHIVSVWIPVVAYIAYMAMFLKHEDTNRLDRLVVWNSPNFNPLAVVVAFALGVLVWTKLEYVLHRFLFHLDNRIPNYSLAKFVHFTIHGIHHFVPMDRDRLVFPPILSIVVLLGMWNPFLWVIPGAFGRLMIAGALNGYVFYDVCHFYLHHGTPGNSYFADLKTYHLKHHYKNPKRGYGVSSKLWDVVYNALLNQ